MLALCNDLSDLHLNVALVSKFDVIVRIISEGNWESEKIKMNDYDSYNAYLSMKLGEHQ